MSVAIKVNDKLHQVTNLGVNIAGTWHTTTDNYTYIKVGGVWKQVLPTLLYTITDTFSRSATSSGLGQTETGFQTWSNVRGNWYINNNQQAQTDTPSDYAIATVGMNDENVAISLDIDPNNAGAGASFWVQDSDNWWGVVSNAITGQQASTYCVSSSNFCVAGYTVTIPPTCVPYYYETYSCFPVYASNCAYYGSYLQCRTVQTGYACHIVNHSGCNYVGGGSYFVCNQSGSRCDVYGTQYTPVLGGYQLSLIKSVGGVISTVQQYPVTSSISSLEILTSGSTITMRAYSGTGQTNQLNSDFTYTATSPTTAQNHGLLLAPGGFNQGAIADNVTIAPN
jgi:hypothetical protein